jgi:hypothetical protein
VWHIDVSQLISHWHAFAVDGGTGPDDPQLLHAEPHALRYALICVVVGPAS